MFDKEYFHRWCETYRTGIYMQYMISNFERIAREAYNKGLEDHKRYYEEKKKEEFKNSAYGKLLEGMKDYRNKYLEELANDSLFVTGTEWKVGDILKIKLPSEKFTANRL